MHAGCVVMHAQVYFVLANWVCLMLMAPAFATTTAMAVYYWVSGVVT